MAQGPRHFSESFVSSGVRSTLQYLSDAQKAQVLSNIGLGSIEVGANISIAANANLVLAAGATLNLATGVTMNVAAAPCADNTYANPTSITTSGGIITAIS